MTTTTCIARMKEIVEFNQIVDNFAQIQYSLLKKKPSNFISHMN